MPRHLARRLPARTQLQTTAHKKPQQKITTAPAAFTNFLPSQPSLAIVALFIDHQTRMTRTDTGVASTRVRKLNEI